MPGLAPDEGNPAVDAEMVRRGWARWNRASFEGEGRKKAVMPRVPADATEIERAALASVYENRRLRVAAELVAARKAVADKERGRRETTVALDRAEALAVEYLRQTGCGKAQAARVVSKREGVNRASLRNRLKKVGPE